MKVSIIIPCHNGGQTLAATLTSALAQTHPPYEVIVVDDRSSDSSATVAREFGDAVRLFPSNSGSASAARRFGVTVAGGEALMFLDADDLVGPTALEAMVGALTRHPRAIACCPWFRLDIFGTEWRPAPPSCPPRAPVDDDLAAWLRGWYHPPCSVLWSRQAYQRSGGWDPGLCVNDDGDIMMRAFVEDVPLVAAVEGWAYYRRAVPGKITLSSRRYSREGLQSRLRVILRIGRLLHEKNRLELYREALGAALETVAADCQIQDADLHLQCRAAEAEFTGSFWRRTAQKVLRNLHAVSDRHRTKGVERNELPSRMQSASKSPRGIFQAPDVTVIIPTYNRMDLIRRALDSVLAQTYRSFEVIVVDDGSTDATRDAVAGYADPRIRYMKQSRNQGPAAARNRGLARARGRFIAFLDSDDEWMPRKLEVQVEFFDRLSVETGLIYTGIEIDEADGRSKMVLPGHRGDVFEALLRENVIYGGGSNAMVRSSVVSSVGCFDESLQAMEDYDYWLRIARSYRVDFVSEPLTRYYNANVAKSATARVSQKLNVNAAARRRIHEKHASEMRRQGVAHSFLLEGARRILRSEQGDERMARGLVLEALAIRPATFQIYPWLLYMLLPSRARRFARDLDGQLRRLLTRSVLPREMSESR